MSDEIQERLRSLLVRLGAPEARTARLGPSDDLVEHGLLDSVAALGLVAKIEREFGVRVPPRELVMANFKTLAAMERLVSRLKRESR